MNANSQICQTTLNLWKTECLHDQAGPVFSFCPSYQVLSYLAGQAGALGSSGLQMWLDGLC